MQKVDESTIAIQANLGDATLPGMSVRDIGPIVVSILRRPEEHLGNTYGVCGDNLPLDQYVQLLDQHLPTYKVQYESISTDEMSKLGYPGAAEIANMLYFMKNTHCCQRDVVETRRLCPPVQDFATWLQEQDPAGFSATVAFQGKHINSMIQSRRTVAGAELPSHADIKAAPAGTAVPSGHPEHTALRPSSEGDASTQM